MPFTVAFLYIFSHYKNLILQWEEALGAISKRRHANLTPSLIDHKWQSVTSYFFIDVNKQSSYLF